MAKRVWDEIDEEMERLGAFEAKSKSQVLYRTMGKRGMKAQRGFRRGEDKIANIVTKRVCRGTI
ncbi:MAG: hypothetical protein NTX52_05300 [Planctomycetota bacterium]|nr:hypothetical protein [Planctomycetota bacterium]